MLVQPILIFFVAAIAASLLSGVAGAFTLTLLARYKIGVGVFADGFSSATAITIVMSIIALLNGVVGLVMKGFISWYDDIKLKEDLTKKNYETELTELTDKITDSIPIPLFKTSDNEFLQKNYHCRLL